MQRREAVAEDTLEFDARDEFRVRRYRVAQLSRAQVPNAHGVVLRPGRQNVPAAVSVGGRKVDAQYRLLVALKRLDAVSRAQVPHATVAIESAAIT